MSTPIINIALTYVNKNSRKICPITTSMCQMKNCAMRSNQHRYGWQAMKFFANRCIILASCLHLKFIHATTLSPERHSDESHEIHLRGRCCLTEKATCSLLSARQKLSICDGLLPLFLFDAGLQLSTCKPSFGVCYAMIP